MKLGNKIFQKLKISKLIAGSETLNTKQKYTTHIYKYKHNDNVGWIQNINSNNNKTQTKPFSTRKWLSVKAEQLSALPIHSSPLHTKYHVSPELLQTTMALLSYLVTWVPGISIGSVQPWTATLSWTDDDDDDDDDDNDDDDNNDDNDKDDDDDDNYYEKEEDEEDERS